MLEVPFRPRGALPDPWQLLAGWMIRYCSPPWPVRPRPLLERRQELARDRSALLLPSDQPAVFAPVRNRPGLWQQQGPKKSRRKRSRLERSCATVSPRFLPCHSFPEAICSPLSATCHAPDSSLGLFSFFLCAWRPHASVCPRSVQAPWPNTAPASVIDLSACAWPASGPSRNP